MHNLLNLGKTNIASDFVLEDASAKEKETETKK